MEMLGVFFLFVAGVGAILLAAHHHRRQRLVPFLLYGKGRHATRIVFPTMGVEIDMQTGRIK